MRLPFWSRPAPDERQHAIATLKSLGTTSLPGLAAALSWSVPHTEQVLRELLRHGPAGLVYDMRTGTIRWGPPTDPPPRPSPPSSPSGTNPSWATSTPRGPTRPAPGPPSIPPAAMTRSDAYRTAAAPAAPGPTWRDAANDHALRECGRCHTPLVPTDIADVFACPMCGRRVTSGGTLVSPSPSRVGAPAGPDPKIQQLIAAWATGQAAPCPHCHQPLRHTADGEFRCGSCGARISYGTGSTTSRPAPLAGESVVGSSR